MIQTVRRRLKVMMKQRNKRMMKSPNLEDILGTSITDVSVLLVSSCSCCSVSRRARS